MGRPRTYLDWNASAPLRGEAREAMLVALEICGNPSSPHAEGRRARAVVEDARDKVAALVGARPAEIVFTSGGTEANNAVVAAPWDSILACGIEHDSVLAPARNGKSRLVELPVTRTGVVDLESLGGQVATLGGGHALLSLQMANNETGAVQPVPVAAALAKEHGLAVHTDAVQAAGRIPIDMGALGVDYLTLSAHKIGGPKGVGALVVRAGAGLPSFITGGGQERRRRAGTENVAAIAGFGAAAAAACEDLAQVGRVRALRDRLEAEARQVRPEAQVIAAEADRLANTSSLALPGASAETLVIAFDLDGIAVSAGAACSSGKVGVSHVLTAMGVAPEIARAAIRVSLGPSTTERDISVFVAAWTRIAAVRHAHAVA